MLTITLAATVIDLLIRTVYTLEQIQRKLEVMILNAEKKNAKAIFRDCFVVNT